MDVKSLYTLVAIADRGSFAEAAKSLGISLPAVSMQMSALEDELGIKIFDRSRRPPVLTEKGLYLTKRARELIAHWESLSDYLKRDTTGAILKLGAVHTAVSGILPVALRLLQEQDQEIEIRLTSGLTHELEMAVLRGELDAAVVSEPEVERPELEFLPVLDERLVLITHTSVSGNSEYEILQNNPYVRFNRLAHVARMVQNEFRKREINVSSTMEIDTIEGVIAMVANGLGVSVVPDRGFLQKQTDSIRKIPFGDPPISRRLGLLILRNNPRIQFAHLLLHALKEAAQEIELLQGK